MTNTHALWAWSVNHVFLLSLLASVPSDFTHRVELLSAVVHSPGSESFARISLLLLLGGAGRVRVWPHSAHALSCHPPNARVCVG